MAEEENEVSAMGREGMDETKKKVVFIDPWGTNNTGDYLNGILSGLQRRVDLEVFTNQYFECLSDEIVLHRVFFKKSERMKNGILRSVIRACEYIAAYRKIVSYLKKRKKVDVVHINWLLLYSVDPFFLKKIKKYTDKLILTAHNVIPHINGEKKVGQLRKIYSLFDTVIVHGNCIRDEFASYFPEMVNKVYVQTMGANLRTETGYDPAAVPAGIVEKVSQYKKICIAFGLVFYNKGFDRLIAGWDAMPNDVLLIVCGKTDENYAELERALEKNGELPNLLYLNGYVPNDTLNYLIAASDLVALPYRHASMSGVLFTAVDFEKTVVCTDVGSLSEYLDEGDSFLCENTDGSIVEKIAGIYRDYTPEKIKELGKRYSERVKRECSWQSIADKLIQTRY